MTDWTPIAHPAVVDLSRNNQGPHLDDAEFYAALRAAGVQLVIHKASQGEHYLADGIKTYQRRRLLATSAGLAWDAYHFYDSAPVDKQIAYFLSVAELGSDSRGALDCEMNDAGTIAPAEAARGAQLLDDKLGHQALRYTGAGYVTAKNRAVMRPFLTGPLWLAKYGPAPTAAYLKQLGMNPDDLVLWQFSGSGVIVHEHPIDLSCFHGTPDQLAGWPNLTRFPMKTTDARDDSGKGADARARLTLRYGEDDPAAQADCVYLQRGLHLLGLPAVVSGNYDEATVPVVRTFQQLHRLTADGVVGPLTWAALDLALKTQGVTA